MNGAGQPAPHNMTLEYNDIIQKYPQLDGVLDKKSWDYISVSNKTTLGLLKKTWLKNIRKNKLLYEKHGGIPDDCVGMGFNKAVVAVGAGPSLKKNIRVLKELHDRDGLKSFEERDFIIVASNHQFKPLLHMGIIPDFVIAVDASDVIYDQLCKNVPRIGNNTIFLAGLQMSPKVLKEWDRQGRSIRFYLPATKGLDKAFEKATGKSARTLKINVGGNVMNTSWVISMYYFHSRVFMALGCDLSYPIIDDIEERRKAYYADGDYSTNAKVTGTGRDEAKGKRHWMSYSIKKSPIIVPNEDINSIKQRYEIEIDAVHTTQNLWVYKTWIEAQVLFNAAKGKKFHYFNCSEGGIMGVMCSADNVEDRNKEDSWYMLDEKCNRWHTMLLEDAVKVFHDIKRRYECQKVISQGVLPATGLVHANA